MSRVNRKRGRAYLGAVFARRLFFLGGPCVCSLSSLALVTRCLRFRGAFVGAVFSCGTWTFLASPESTPCVIGGGGKSATVFSFLLLVPVFLDVFEGSFARHEALALDRRFFGGCGASSVPWVRFVRAPARARLCFLARGTSEPSLSLPTCSCITEGTICSTLASGACLLCSALIFPDVRRECGTDGDFTELTEGGRKRQC